MLSFEWAAGFADSQKRKNIAQLHRAATEAIGIDRLLEISTKSPDGLGVALSAFNLDVVLDGLSATHKVEAVFQASKVFEHGGPHLECLESLDTRQIRDLVRNPSLGSLIRFETPGHRWPIRPMTFFYDWLYLNALVQKFAKSPQIESELLSFGGFTDIEFNPKKSANCQARSCALYIGLGGEEVRRLITKPEQLRLAMAAHSYGPTPDPAPEPPTPTLF